MTSARTRTAKATNPKVHTRGGPVAALLGLLFALVLLLALVEAVGACVPLYRQALRQAAVADGSVLTETGFEAALRRTLDYTRGRVPDLQMYVHRASPVDLEPAFSERELAHMADVRALFAGARLIRAGAAALILAAALLTVGGLGRSRWGPGAKAAALRLWGRTLVWSAGWGLAFGVGVAALALVDFGWAFDQFHYIFFANDLWLLPLDSLLITMLPMWQFARLAAIIGGTFAFTQTLALVAGRRMLSAAAGLSVGFRQGPGS